MCDLAMEQFVQKVQSQEIEVVKDTELEVMFVGMVLLVPDLAVSDMEVYSLVGRVDLV